MVYGTERWELIVKPFRGSGPYLASGAPKVDVVHNLTDCYTEVTVHGGWSPQLRTSISEQLQACLAEHPRAVVIDLSNLSDPEGRSASAWRTVARYAGTRGPAARVLICAAPAPLRQRLRADDPTKVTVLNSTGDAHTMLTAVPMPPSVALPLPADPMSACTGRTAAGDACSRWGLAPLSHLARLITSELITNAVGHACTGLVLQVSLRTGVLHLAVQDSSPVLPRLLTVRPYHLGQPIELPGAGLRIVDAAATAWGALTCRDGKVVWATLAASERGAA
jgi:hypothetical protein